MKKVLLIILFLYIFIHSAYTQNVKDATITLPYSEFIKLIKKPITPNEQKPPIDYIISDTNYNIIVKNSKTNIKINAKINIFKKGYNEIQLLNTTNTFISQAYINSKPANIYQKNGYYYILLKGRNYYNLTLYINLNTTKTISIPLLKSSIKKINIKYLKNLELQSNNLNIIEKTQKNNFKIAKGYINTDNDWININVIKNFSVKKVNYKYKKSRIDTTSYTLFTIYDNLIIGTTQFSYMIRYKPIKVIKLKKESNINIVDITGGNIFNWQEKDNIITIYLDKPIIDNYNFSIRYEIPYSINKDFNLTIINPINVYHKKGFIGITSSANYQITAKQIKNCTAIDVKNLPQIIWDSARKPLILGYKYTDKDLSIKILINKYKEIPVLIATIDSENIITVVNKNGLSLTKAVFYIRNNTKQFLKVKLPEGCKILSAFVNNKGVKLSIDKENNIMIPLVKSQKRNQQLTRFPVEIYYLNDLKSFFLLSLKTINLPLTDIPISQINYSIYLPNKNKYLLFFGSLDRVRYFTNTNNLTNADKTYSLGAIPSTSERKLKSSYFSRQQQYELEKEVISKSSQKQGVLPVKIAIPQKGYLVRFSQTLPLNSKSHISMLSLNMIFYNLLTYLIFIYIFLFAINLKDFSIIKEKKFITKLIIAGILLYYLDIFSPSLFILITTIIGKFLYTKSLKLINYLKEKQKKAKTPA